MTKKTRVVAAALGAVAISLLFVAGALAQAPTYTITLDKAATPPTLPSGGGDVTYWYTVTNTGTGFFQSVGIEDDPECTPIEFDSSDDGTDPATPGDKLDSGHWWKFSCDAALTATTTNTATAVACHSGSDCDSSGAHEAEATDSATVTVGTSTDTLDLTGTSAAMLALILLAIGGIGFLGTTNRLPKLPKFR